MELREAITTRRSVRKYKSDPIPEQTVKELLELAAWAPSGMNTQPWLYVVIEGKDYLKDLSDKCKAYLLDIMEELPALQIYRTSLSNPDNNIFYGAPSLVLIYGNQNAFTYPNDCSMAALNLMLAAWERGIGSCWIGFARAFCGTPEFKEELKVPPEYQLVATVILGYPAGPPVKGSRKDIKVSFHRK
ncbi:nitroreductase family protein [Pelotomaculum propionicicum]|uniref:nitroreductase family protein n=1 Tax=Pelotomaculum propionicicum TaxID=258475 RepID=UPI003B7CB82C